MKYEKKDKLRGIFANAGATLIAATILLSTVGIGKGVHSIYQRDKEQEQRDLELSQYRIYAKSQISEFYEQNPTVELTVLDKNAVKSKRVARVVDPIDRGEQVHYNYYDSRFHNIGYHLLDADGDRKTAETVLLYIVGAKEGQNLSGAEKSKNDDMVAGLMPGDKVLAQSRGFIQPGYDRETGRYDVATVKTTESWRSELYPFEVFAVRQGR